MKIRNWPGKEREGKEEVEEEEYSKLIEKHG